MSITVRQILEAAEASVRQALIEAGIIVQEYEVAVCGCGNHTNLTVKSEKNGKQLVDIFTLGYPPDTSLDNAEADRLADYISELPAMVTMHHDKSHLDLDEIVRSASNLTVSGVLVIYTETGGIQRWDDYVGGNNAHLN